MGESPRSTGNRFPVSSRPPDLPKVVIYENDHPTQRRSYQSGSPPDLTQEEAGAVVKSARRTWQDWERGRRKMPAGLFDLFKLKRV